MVNPVMTASKQRPADGLATEEDGEAAGPLIELVTGAIAAGGGCVARADDGRVVFVRHALPGERVIAKVTSQTKSFLRADAVEILEPSADRVSPPCPHAGPGRCGGCDWQHVSLSRQRQLKASLIAEQLRRLAGVDWEVEVEEVAHAAEGLGWRTRVRFAVDETGRPGLRRHRSRVIEPIESCPIATDGVNDVKAPDALWRGAHHVEVMASPDTGSATVAVETGRRRLAGKPKVHAGLVVNGRTVKRPDRVAFKVGDNRFEISAGVFWQVHAGAASILTTCVMAGLKPEPGERVADLYAGAGLFTVPLARAVGPRGAVLAVERSGRSCADAVHNADGLHHVEILRADVTDRVVAEDLGDPDLIVLDPAREGAGLPVMGALAALRPAPRAIAYVSCDPASYARDLRVMLDEGWTMSSLRAFDCFPMTEHVELVGILLPPT
jgi:tRNA/tmRNA/rRNA uracil-C5-methylase (TrmA/RlmC/RlmD family)